MTKCTFCYDEIDQGKPPTCVAACPLRVLDFGELADLAKKYESVKDVYPLPDSSLTEPSFLITPHKDAHRADFEDTEIANREEV